MVELDRQGCKWANGDKTTESTGDWEVYSSETCVKVDEKAVVFSEKGYYTSSYPDVQIIKYKAKVDEKMKFTKENVYKLAERYSYFTNDLQDEIHNLDDTPEKVAVPKFVAEWYESQTSSGYNIHRMIKDLLNGSVSEEAVFIWLSRNYSKYGLRDRFDLLALIRINGYTIEPEKLYCIPLPHLETADGTKQYLTKSGSGNYFALSPCVGQKQRYTKEELERVPEIYKPFVKPIEEEE